MASVSTFIKFIICFAVIFALSPLFYIFLPVLVPLILTLIISLLYSQQQTIAFLLKLYHNWNLFKIKYLYRSTPENVSHDRLITGQAWSEFCDTLKGAQSAISNGPQDALSQAEGYRFLARVVMLYCSSYSRHLYILYTK